MNQTYNDFVESCDNPSSRAVYKHYSRISQYDVDAHSLDNLKQFIQNTTFSSLRDFFGFNSTFRSYAKFIRNIDLLNDLDRIDVNDIKEKLRQSAEKRYITYEEYQDLLHDVEMCEEFNELFYVTLLMCVYEGLFGGSFDALSVLRKSDIDGNMVTLHLNDGSLHTMKVSHQLAQNLNELADTTYWERRTPSGSVVKNNVIGVYPDSVFKFALRRPKSIQGNTRNILQIKFGKLMERYEYQITPKQLFYSGIIHRASVACQEKYNLDLIAIFSNKEYIHLVNELLRDELANCRYNLNYTTFRYNIVENMKDFKKS